MRLPNLRIVPTPKLPPLFARLRFDPSVEAVALEQLARLDVAAVRESFARLVGQLDLSLENTESQMTWVGEQLLAYGKVISPKETRQRLGEVRPAQVRAAAREFFRPERMNLAVVSPLKSADGLMALLSR